MLFVQAGHYATEALSSIRTVHAFGLQREMQKKFEAVRAITHTCSRVASLLSVVAVVVCPSGLNGLRLTLIACRDSLFHFVKASCVAMWVVSAWECLRASYTERTRCHSGSGTIALSTAFVGLLWVSFEFDE